MRAGVFDRKPLPGKSSFLLPGMKNSQAAMIFCNDGFRPVRFCLEALDGDAQ